MDANDISGIILRDRHLTRIFRGCHSMDELPHLPLTNTPFAIIVNTLRSYESGIGHWVSIFSRKPGNVIVFDSLGGIPKQSELIAYLQRNFKSITFSRKRIQNVSSLLCGLYAVDFIMTASRIDKNIGDVDLLVSYTREFMAFPQNDCLLISKFHPLHLLDRNQYLEC